MLFVLKEEGLDGEGVDKKMLNPEEIRGEYEDIQHISAQEKGLDIGLYFMATHRGMVD